MSEPEIDKQILNQYLLGALSESETDRLDELSITDDAFVVRLTEAEHDLIDSYVGDELQGATLERFKSHYLSSPARRNKVKFATTLQEAVQAKNPFPVTGPARVSWFAGLFNSPVMRWGFSAAALVLIVATILLVGQNIRLRQEISQRQADDEAARKLELELKDQIESQRAARVKTETELAQLRADRDRLDRELEKEPTSATVVSLILAPQLRSAGQAATLPLTTSTRTVVVHLRLEPNDFTNFRVALLDQVTHQNIWTSSKIKAKGAANEKALSISFPTGLLKSQGYTLQVSGISDNDGLETVGEYYFRVVK